MTDIKVSVKKMDVLNTGPKNLTNSIDFNSLIEKKLQSENSIHSDTLTGGNGSIQEINLDNLTEGNSNILTGGNTDIQEINLDSLTEEVQIYKK